MAVYEMKYMYDWGSGVCLWSTNDNAREKYGYPVFADDLPVSDELKDEIRYMTDKHDEALNWHCPNDDLLWNDEQTAAFKQEARKLYNRICLELGGDYYIEFCGDMLI